MPDHILRYGHIVVNLPIMDLKLESDEVGEDSCGACLGLDRNNLLSWDWANDWKTVF